MHTRGVDNGVTSGNVGARDARRCVTQHQCTVYWSARGPE